MTVSTIYKSAAGQKKIAAWIETQLQQFKLTAQKIMTPEGDAHFIESGNPDKPAVLMLPGTNFSALSYQAYFALLGGDFRLIALDLMGQPGRSSPVRPKFKDVAYSKWIKAVLDALKIDKAHLVGHSLGGLIALQTAHVAPERVGKLILLDPAGIISLSVTPHLIWKSMPFVIRPNERSSKQLLELMSPHPIDAAMIEWMMLVGKYVKSSLAPPALSQAELRQIPHEVLVISGEKDVFLPAAKLRQKTQQSFTKGQVKIVPDAGHLLPQEQPEVVASYIREFLAYS
ncbi:MAG: alpha/beta hydrolase [Chloroflexi bacterium]|nr:alpha/beta hydrolase [Chloroflexota bacterium]